MDIRYSIFSARTPNSDQLADYEKSYALYKSVWQNAFNELELLTDRLADEFTRQDYICALFYQDQCVGLNFLRYTNFNLSAFAEDSWFKCWTPNVVEKLNQLNASNGVVNSFFSVGSEYRKSTTQHNFGLMLASLAVIWQYDQNIDHMYGNMRKSRSMDKLGHILACTVLEDNVLHNDEPSQLILFERKKIAKAILKMPLDIKNIYNNRSQGGINERLIPVKRVS